MTHRIAELDRPGSAAPPVAEPLLFEFPLTERVRSWLRLEEQFHRIKLLAARREPLDHRAALLSVFEIIDTATRMDLKSDLLQELDRQRALWRAQSSHPEVEAQALEEFLHDVETAISDLHAQLGRPGQHLRENDWLSQLRQRASSPGGACDVELPMLKAWLALGEARRKSDLKHWLDPLSPLDEAVTLVLRLLRGSGMLRPERAPNGSFHRSLDGVRSPLLAIIRVETGWAVVPELSANRYAINVRWLEHGGQFTRAGRAQVTTRDIPFEMALCRL
ncbi:MAG: cell division protein ZapD [Casimicrobiaceae bacterium]